MNLIWVQKNGKMRAEYRPWLSKLCGVVHRGKRPDIIQIGLDELAVRPGVSATLARDLHYITGSLVYVDGDGDSAYRNGGDHSLPYEPNDDYEGSSVLGVIANNEILYTDSIPNDFELNGSFLSRTGRVGITGIKLDEDGNASLAR